MFERFTKSARDVVGCALLEAQRRGEHRVGTQHLLLGLLRQGGSSTTTALGADLAAGREALDDLDRAALAAVGVEAWPAVADGDSEPTKVTRLPFTAGAKAVLVRALREAGREGSRSLTADHLLLAVVDAEPPDAALDLLERLGSSPAVVRSRLRPAA